MNREEIIDLLNYAKEHADWETIEIEPAELAELAETALRALGPARVICPSAGRDQECEGCPHGIEHDKHCGCGPNTGNRCPACVEVKP